jgi:hypothetical protein
MLAVARRPKPSAALRELRGRARVIAPEPNPWRDLLTRLDQRKNSVSVSGGRVSIQECGVTNPELSAGLYARGAMVSAVKVDRWALPENCVPLDRAIDSIIRYQLHVLRLASSVHIRHLFEAAAKMRRAEALRQALSPVVITSGGALTSEKLRKWSEHGHRVHPAENGVSQSLRTQRAHCAGKQVHP